jgi:hypothetical protein
VFRSEEHIWLHRGGGTSTDWSTAHLFAAEDHESYCGGVAVRVAARPGEQRAAWEGTKKCRLCEVVYVRSQRVERSA